MIAAKRPKQKRSSRFLASLAVAITTVFSKKKPKPTTEDLARAEFKTSTQRMGVRFTKRLRDVFRFRWLRKF